MVGDLRVPPEKDREEIVVNAVMILEGMARARGNVKTPKCTNVLKKRHNRKS